MDRETLAKQIGEENPELSESWTWRTPCTSAILEFFGITRDQFKFCQTIEDMQRIFRRNGWSMKKIPVRAKRVITWVELNLYLDRGFYVVSIDGHVFLIYIDENGGMRLQVDTGEDYRDEYPEIEGVYRVSLKK